ncbi:sesquiterpene synthase-like [Chenopodium quinoa]|uniref:Terpene synthase metal-binding domain-containing protein n=1 Tax=Chenopodium quinoa TaxID=63459 RepID=A0A803N694_CHEQI|nr:sesquiterpene synthase-like [Chenopodium quinoa]
MKSNVPKMISTMFRLDFVSSGNMVSLCLVFEQKRKHVASAVQCLMEKHALSEEEANEKLKEQVEDAWKDINQAMLQLHVIPKPLLMRILNFARSANVIYKDDADGYTHVNQTLKDKVASVLAHPIPL